MKRGRLVCRIGLVACLLATCSGDGRAFLRDTHYYLTFGLALSTCFAWDEAHLIASANLMIDQNESTVAETDLTRKSMKRNWHAFGHSEERYRKLWYRVLNEDDAHRQLIEFGQFLHFLQDWESHAGYPLTIGHAVATTDGRDPDSLAGNADRTAAMVQGTLDHMGRLCDALGRFSGTLGADEALLEAIQVAREDGFVGRMIEDSRPDWRSPTSGGLTDRGLRIVETNRRHVEEYIAANRRDHPELGIPDGFTPGGPAGFPAPITLRFDGDGRVVSESATTGPDTGAETGGDQWLRIASVREAGGGWRVRATLANRGTEALPGGFLRLVAIDPVTREQIGDASRTILPLKKGKKTEIDVLIPVKRPAAQVLIGAVADVADLSAANNYVWYMSRRDRREFVNLEADETEPSHVTQIEFLGEPRPWLTSAGELCLTVEARTDARDPTGDLERPTITAGEGGPPLEGAFARIWSIAPTGPTERPGAKTFDCFDPATSVCDPEGAVGAATLRIVLNGDQATASATVSLEPLQDRLGAICAEAASNPS